jgi:hypothetical protein
MMEAMRGLVLALTMVVAGCSDDTLTLEEQIAKTKSCCADDPNATCEFEHDGECMRFECATYVLLTCE